MSRPEPVAYVYEGEIHRPECALLRFGRHDGLITGTDDDGNEIGPVMAWSELLYPDDTCQCDNSAALAYLAEHERLVAADIEENIRENGRCYAESCRGEGRESWSDRNARLGGTIEHLSPIPTEGAA